MSDRPFTSSGGKRNAVALGTSSAIGVLLMTSNKFDVLDAITGNRSCKEGPAWDRLCEMHGGDKAQAVGTKKAPGPLYGVGSHARSALAVAVVAAQRIEKGIAP